VYLELVFIKEIEIRSSVLLILKLYDHVRTWTNGPDTRGRLSPVPIPGVG
jgi:hypothetical protein